MNSNVLFMMAVICMGLFISSCYGMNIFTSNDNRFDASHPGFNSENVTIEFAKRHEGKCVRCKFGLISCCEPNICVKKTLSSDKCMHVKVGK